MEEPHVKDKGKFFYNMASSRLEALRTSPIDIPVHSSTNSTSLGSISATLNCGKLRQSDDVKR